MVAVGTHDTASAVVAVPAADREFAYVSSGTWSLVGLELDQPVITDDSRAANFTNEGGVDRRVRFLRNEGGLWLLQESQRQWSIDGEEHELAILLEAAADVPAGGPTIDVDDPAFIAPDDMPSRIQQACRDTGQDVPAGQAEIVRCILDSLAIGYAKTVAAGERLAGRPVSVIHIVGGGCQNELLCQLTADLSGHTVLAGPVEATALGNVMVQARAAGVASGDLEALRAGVRAGLRLQEYQPSAEHQRALSS